MVAFRLGVSHRLRFLWRCLMAALEEAGRIAQDNRLVGALIFASALITAVSVGAAVIAVFVFETVIPIIVVPSILTFLVLAEGGYLEWSLARSSPPIDADAVEPKLTEIPDDQMGLLDYVPESVRAMQEFTQLQQRLTKSQNRTGRQISKYSGRLDREPRPVQKQRLQVRTADEIDRNSKVFEVVLPVLGAKARRFGKGIQGFITKAPIISQQDKDAVRDFRQNMVVFRTSIVNNRKIFGDYRQAVIGLRARDLGWHINEAAERHLKCANTMVSLLEEIDTSCKNAIGSIDTRMKSLTSKSKSESRRKRSGRGDR